MVSGVVKNTQLDKLDGLIKQQLQILMMMQQADKFKASLGINQFSLAGHLFVSRQIMHQKVPQTTVT